MIYFTGMGNLAHRYLSPFLHNHLIIRDKQDENYKQWSLCIKSLYVLFIKDFMFFPSWLLCWFLSDLPSLTEINNSIWTNLGYFPFLTKLSKNSENCFPLWDLTRSEIYSGLTKIPIQTKNFFKYKIFIWLGKFMDKSGMGGFNQHFTLREKSV